MRANLRWLGQQAGMPIFLVGIALIIGGCASPKAVVESPGDVPKYRKVYLGVPKEDPRKVYPRILGKLKQCGFDVVEVSPDGPAVGTQASGFVFTSQGHLLTCAHVVQGAGIATVWIQNVRHPARVLSVDTNLDVALLQVESEKPLKPLAFAPDATYRMGQDVFTMGFPLVELLGTSPRLNKGLVSSTVGLEDDANQIQISAPVQPGNSGGPLLNAEGQVVGLAVSTLNPIKVLAHSGGNLPQNVNFGIKNQPMLEFLRNAGVQPSTAQISSGADGFEAARESLAIVRAGNVRNEDLTAPSMICFVRYLSFWDVWYRFRIFHMEFHDAKTDQRILRVGQYADNMFSSEDGVIEKTFKEIYPKFFPGRPNPFNSSEAKPTPEPK